MTPSARQSNRSEATNTLEMPSRVIGGLSQALNALGVEWFLTPRTRTMYVNTLTAWAIELDKLIGSGRVSLMIGYEFAHELRNLTLAMTRSKGTRFLESIAVAMKTEGVPLAELIGKELERMGLDPMPIG